MAASPGHSMDKGVAVLLTAAVGVLIAGQSPINSRLGLNIGSFQAATVSFVVGTVLLVAISLLFAGGFGELRGQSLPWHYFIGGALGAAYIVTVIVTLQTLGAGGVAAATISGQLIASIALDHFGMLGLDRNPVTWTRAVGGLMLVLGTWLVVRGR